MQSSLLYFSEIIHLRFERYLSRKMKRFYKNYCVICEDAEDFDGLTTEDAVTSINFGELFDFG